MAMSFFVKIGGVLGRSINSNIQVLQGGKCFFSAKALPSKIIKEIDPITGEKKSKKSIVSIPKITLVSGEAVSITTLPEAEKLSKRRDLRLVKIDDVDTKTQRPLYKLMTGTEYHEEELKQRELRKKHKENQYIRGEKLLLLNAKISEHDLQIQMKKAAKWTERMLEVRIVINSTSKEISEKIYSTFEEYFKKNVADVKLVQKRLKGAELKFQILPPRRKKDDNETGSPSL